jgi:hypothetical protein
MADDTPNEIAKNDYSSAPHRVYTQPSTCPWRGPTFDAPTMSWTRPDRIHGHVCVCRGGTVPPISAPIGDANRRRRCDGVGADA